MFQEDSCSDRRCGGAGFQKFSLQPLGRPLTLPLGLELLLEYFNGIFDDPFFSSALMRYGTLPIRSRHSWLSASMGGEGKLGKTIVEC